MVKFFKSNRNRVFAALILTLALTLAMAGYLGSYYRADHAAVEAYVEAGGITTTELNGMIVCEHDRNTPPDTPPNLILQDRREYGNTGISFFVRQEE